MTYFQKAACVLILSSGSAFSAPFGLTGPDEIRADATVTWADFSTTHGTAVNSTVGFTPSDGGAQVTTAGGSLFIHSAGGLFTPGVLLGNSDDLFVVSFGGETIQGVGFTIEHQLSVQAEYTVRYFAPNGELLGSIVTPSPGTQGNPAFMGFIDPDARIGSFTVEATPSNHIVISNLLIQRKPEPVTDFSTLPVASTQTLEISPEETYLHQGVSFFSRKSPETTTAVLDNDNAFDLLALFPSLRPGDIIRFQRQGINYDGGKTNHTAAVFSSSETLLAGDEISRLVSVIPAGQPIITHPVSTGDIKIPTDIGGDFVVPDSTFVTIPNGARYLFTTLQEPGGDTLAPDIKLSHIPRQPFLDWVAAKGLAGSLADPQSDLDGDGLTLLEEFAYSKDPTVRDSSRPADFAFEPFLATSSPRLSFNIGVRRDAPIRYRPEYSSDLVNWETLPESNLSTITSSGTRVILNSTDPTGGPRRFSRIRMDYIPSP